MSALLHNAASNRRSPRLKTDRGPWRPSAHIGFGLRIRSPWLSLAQEKLLRRRWLRLAPQVAPFFARRVHCRSQCPTSDRPRAAPKDARHWERPAFCGSYRFRHSGSRPTREQSHPDLHRITFQCFNVVFVCDAKILLSFCNANDIERQTCKSFNHAV